MNTTARKLSGKTRSEHDLIGDMEIPVEFYFGVQTMRALENFEISRSKLYHYPQFILGLADVKAAAALANHDLGLLDTAITNAIVEACTEIKNGKLHDQFVVDMVQGGAGTSTNMNANEVIANRALEIMGYEKGDYKHCHPNNHVNLSQSTNDAYPTALKIAIYRSIGELIKAVEKLIIAFEEKGVAFAQVIKMGRTQLQDAVPMTLGQEFNAFAATLKEEVNRLTQNRLLLLETNMGATAIGTGINSDPEYTPICTRHLAKISGIDVVAAENLIEATSDTGVFIMNSSVIKRLAVKLSKICNDLRLLSSGPRTGLNEINLPPMQPGSSIMPGKVNPVIPEVVNQIAYKVVGNDLTVTMASEAGQLQLNVMEPIIAYSIMESIEMLINGINTLRSKCIVGITANEERLKEMVLNSIGLVTALNPYLGYENSTKVAAEALQTGRGVYDIVLEHKLIDKDKLDEILKPENMIQPRKIEKN
ncbi:aspartate ammonia-lyase [Petrimonas sp.]|uniref:aspartate ammonia-lyase n=1 Tax=Petrimonas sp. TaxID=2023866 RepID=UPI003F51A169